MLRAGPLEMAGWKVREVQRISRAMAMVMGTGEPVRKDKNRSVWAYGGAITMRYGC